MKQNKSATVENIRDKWLCHGCGICKVVCRQNAIEIVYDRKHRNHVPIVDHEKCIQCRLCYDVCPGKEVNFDKISKRFLNGIKYDILAGHYIKNYIAWATDEVIRWNAASGGIATALAKFLLNSGQVDKVISVTKGSFGGSLDFQGTVISNEDDLYKSMGSKYCSVPLCTALKEIPRNDRIAVFGLPCHIHGIRKAQLKDNLFGKLEIILVGIFCGGTKGREATEWIMKKRGLDFSKLIEINYRGNGWPGQMTASFLDGNKLIAPYPDYADFQFGGCRPWRCELCSDGLAELADLSIGDAWLKEITSKNSQGVSMVISRSQKGEKLLKDAISANAIKCKNTDDSDAIKSQYKMLVKKKNKIVGFIMFAKIIGRGIPNYDNIIKGIRLSAIIYILKKEILYFVGRMTAQQLFFYKLFKFVRNLKI